MTRILNGWIKHDNQRKITRKRNRNRKQKPKHERKHKHKLKHKQVANPKWVETHAKTQTRMRKRNCQHKRKLIYVGSIDESECES